ncbi:MAG: HlyD family efflux transporter periplasmic adaptor subunit, partial [Candidatus Magasanikbacteria bacterium]|nr:HlyD family efflux transporter periplasmic adaptor subunit [Candidatus Magasanikbacteria bacterium]
MIGQKIMTKKVLIPAVIVLVIGDMSYGSYKRSHQPIAYETVAVSRGNLTQTVEATGKIESINGVRLRFDVPGTLTSVLAKEGASVQAGALLANLRLGELAAAVAQAEANLNQKLAGATPEDVRYYEAAVQSAQATWDQSAVDLTHATQDTVANLEATLPKLDDALTQADNILGIDNVISNDSFEKFLATSDGSKLVKANADYLVARTARDAARIAVLSLTLASDRGAVETVLAVALNALAQMNQALRSVSDVLRATSPIDVLTPAGLDAKKTTIEATRTTVTSQTTTLVSQKQSLSDAVNTVKVKEAVYRQAVATLDSKVNPPREVDVASYRAALAQAIANRSKALLTAPIAGLITKVNKKIGESVSSADVVVEMLSPHYEIKVDIPETDVFKLKLNNEARITLDAFGEDTKLTGTITAIDPSSTEVEDVVYYTVTVSLADT